MTKLFSQIADNLHMKYVVLAVCLVGCGGSGDPGGIGDLGSANNAGDGAGPAEWACGGSLETSCDVPNDNGIHTCYDDGVIDAARLQAAKMLCTSQQIGGTVLSGCCNHNGAVARCVYATSDGGMSTEWFLSGSAAAAQTACASKNGAFTAL